MTVRERRGSFSPSEIQRIRDTTRISDVIGRFVTWDMKKSNPGRADWWAPCPFHGEKNASFHCEDGKGRYHCFGCGESGDVFKFLQEKAGLTFPEAVAELGGTAEKSQISPAERERARRDRERRIAADRVKQERKQESTRERAFRLWKEGEPLAGTLAETYLRRRGVDFEFSFPSLRFHASMRHPETGDRSPCLMAAVQAPDDRFLGIWRIYLSPDGGKLTGVEAEKLGLGAYIEFGGGVRLGAQHGTVNVVEGIETGFGVYGLTAGRPVLCGLNAGGVESVQPTPDTSRFLIWPDGDVDKIRRIKKADGAEHERHLPSRGIRAAQVLKGRMDELEFPCAIQPTAKNGRDYLDIYNASKRAFAGS